MGSASVPYISIRISPLIQDNCLWWLFFHDYPYIVSNMNSLPTISTVELMTITPPAQSMPVLNVAFVGSEELARTLAKSNDVRDIESYVYKEQREGKTCVLSLLRPLRHPERLRPFSVLNVAEVGIVEITNVDAALGDFGIFWRGWNERGIAIISCRGSMGGFRASQWFSAAGLKTWNCMNRFLIHMI